MKYVSADRLQDFEFHDSMWKLHSYTNHLLILNVRMLNIHSDALQNPHNTDMEIDLARLTFKGIHMQSFDPGRTWKQDAQGNSYTADLPLVYKGTDAEQRFLAELNHGSHGINVFRFNRTGRLCSLDACGNEPWFAVEFSCDSIEIAWDTYLKPAWYTEHKWSKQKRSPSALFFCTKKERPKDVPKRIESGDDLPSRGVTTQVLSAC